MEAQRNQFHALPGICVLAVLVLVSAVPNSDTEWHSDSVPPAGLDAITGRHRRPERVFRHRCGVAAFRNYALGISSGALGRKATVRKCILRRRNGGFCASRSDREIRFANLRRWIAISTYGTAGRDRLQLVSETHPGQNGHRFRI